MKSPAVSVVIAAYNHGQYLAEAVGSALDQTFEDLEILVVDDGSADETPAVMAGFSPESRVRYVRLPHGGPARARNAGARLARAPLVAFLDADDCWCPTKLDRQLPLFRSDDRLAVVHSQRLVFDQAGYELEYRPPELRSGDVLCELLRRNFVCFSSAVVRRDVLMEAGLFDESLPLAVDYDLWLRIAALGYRFGHADEPLVAYRVGHKSLSTGVLERHRAVRRILYRFFRDHAPRLNLRLDDRLIRTILAEHHSAMALHLGTDSVADALGEYLTALRYDPAHAGSWQGLLTFWWLRRLKAAVRKLLRQPRRAPQRLRDVAGTPWQRAWRPDPVAQRGA